MYRLFYYIIYGFLWMLSLLPFRILYIISDALYIVAYYVLGYRKTVVVSNLKNAFPEKSNQEIRFIAKQFYKHLCNVIFETIALLTMSEQTMKRRVTYRNIEIFDDLYKKDKHVCVITGHYGNWEWICSSPLWLQHKSVTLYQPLKNKHFDKLMSKLRTKFGAEIIPKREGVKRILQLHKQETLTASLFIGDQTPMKHEIQYWTTFLNQDTPVYLGIEKIARKSNQAVVFLSPKKIKRGYYEIEIIKISENGKETKPYEITEAHVNLLEKTIRSKPEYWLWSHRRWKHVRSYSHI